MLRIGLAVKFFNPVLLPLNDSILLGSFPLCNLRMPDGSIDLLLIAILQFGDVRFIFLF